MSELKSWGVQRNHFNFIKGCSCPYCDKDYNFDKLSCKQQIVGFTIGCPSFSGKTEEKEIVGTLIIECAGCFEKFWLYISDKIVEELRKSCDNWP